MDNFGQRIKNLEDRVAHLPGLASKVDRQELSVAAIVEILGLDVVQAKVDEILTQQAERRLQQNLAILRANKGLREVGIVSDRSVVILRHTTPDSRGVFNPMASDAALAENERLRGKKPTDTLVSSGGTYEVVAAFDPIEAVQPTPDTAPDAAQ